MRIRQSILFAAALAAAACGSKSAPPAAPAEPAAVESPAVESPAPAEPAVSPAVRAAVDAPDRSADDRALDAGRHPAEVLSFFRIAPGQRVAELFAGFGYTTELLARVVGDQGQVYGQNTKDILDRFARKGWAERVAKPVNKRVVAVERDMGDPLPAEVKDLDAVLVILTYHDTVWMKTDRAAMNKAIFRALKPGGVYGIVDHSAADGSGVRDVETLHRIDQAVVVSEIEAAGFKLDGKSDLLRNPADPRDWNASPRAAADKRGTSDRFVLRFVKP